jgi:hypothetical protein
MPRTIIVLLGPALLVALCTLAPCTTTNANEESLSRNLIPQPKQCLVETGVLPAVTEGKSNLVVLLSANPDPREALAARWVTKEIATLSGTTPEIVRGPRRPHAAETKTQLLLATFNRDSENLEQARALLDEADRALLADPRRSEQGYVIRCDERRVVVVGGSPQGTLYGAMTLIQLLCGGQGNLSLPRVHVLDWPDFKYREAENWTYAEGRLHWGRGWCYDWGDGEANYRKRVEALFDRCLRYKINMICFSSGFGETFSKMWDGDDFPIQKELNQLAAKRGIKLMIGGYGVAAGDPNLLNRESYPDGKEYRCLTTNNWGNCRSNEELTKRIQDRLRDYVRKTEPRALYLHHEDSDTFASSEWLWKHRCARCRKQWPNDAMAAADGAAGAFAHGYNALCDAVFGVKNADSGYDAARDCLVILVSPAYTAEFESDAVWDQELAYWAEAVKLLKHRENVQIGIREQFLRVDNGKRRIREMADVLAVGGVADHRGASGSLPAAASTDKGGQAAHGTQQINGPGMFLFFVSPASIYGRGPLFVPVPAAMNKLNEGAETAYFMCGNIFQEPQILISAAHMWNTDSLGAVALPANEGQCRALYNGYAKRQADPPGVFGDGGFLESACRSLYGKKAGKHMEKLYAMKQFPICFARELYIWNIRSWWGYDWTSDSNVTREAITHVQAALAEADCKELNRPILDRFLKSLKTGEHFIEVRLAYRELTPLGFQSTTSAEELENKAALVEKKIQGMERYLAANFTFDWATLRGGDVGIWKDHLADLRREMKQNMDLWVGSLRAREAVEHAEAAGRTSVVINGDMENATGWKFTRVTGEEQTPFGDGGYASDRSIDGKRSYRVIKPPIEKLSPQWPMPTRTTWGQIEQEIKVEPGRKYAVAFQVFNNNGGPHLVGRLQHEVLVGGKEMWSLDSSASKGWKAGGFFFVPTTPTVRLIFRTTDLLPAAGWSKGEGDSWWDDVTVVPIEPAGQ